MAASGRGVLQVVSDFAQFEEEMATVLSMAASSGRPLSISLAQNDHRPDDWRRILRAIADANGRGLQVTAQVASRPVGLLLGLQATIDPTRTSAIGRALAGRPLEERVARLRDPDVRAQVAAEMAAARAPFRWDKVFVLGDPPNYEPPPEDSLAAMAERAGVAPEVLALEHLVSGEGRGFLYVPFLNYAEGNLDAVACMLADEHSVLGLGDGGAHVGTICDASFQTTMLTHWVRDRDRGQRLELSQAVAKQTSMTAAMAGLGDRGVLRPGFKADLNVIDLDRLRLRAPTMAFDLPAGGKRLLQRAEGYLHTFVSGVETYCDGEHTGALPGRLVRGPQPAPA